MNQLKHLALAAVLLLLPINAHAIGTEELATRLSEKLGISKAEANSDITSVIDVIRGEMIAGNDITIRGFGKFYVQHRDARVARNPKTGEKVDVPAKRYPKFRSSETFKKEMNK